MVTILFQPQYAKSLSYLTFYEEKLTHFFHALHDI